MTQRLLDGILQLESRRPWTRREPPVDAPRLLEALPVQLVCGQRLVHSEKHSREVISPVEAAGQRSDRLNADKR